MKSSTVRARLAGAALFALAFAVQVAAAGDLAPLVHEGVVAAPVADVWDAFATGAGQESWMVAHADVDLRVGGRMQTHYDPNGVLGDPGTIENTILAFEPRRMLALRVAKAPASFPFRAEVAHMWTVIYFEPRDGDVTWVRIVGLGFGHDASSSKMREFFDRGNAYTLGKLQQRFAARRPDG